MATSSLGPSRRPIVRPGWRPVARALVLLTLLPMGGCYVYGPSDPGAVLEGQRVRARLSPTEFTRLESFVVPGSRTLEGRLEQADGDSLLVSVTVHSEIQGNRIRNLAQRVKVARAGILDLEAQRLDRPRTAFIAGAGAAVLVSIAVMRARNEGTPGGPPDGPPPVDARIPLLRFALPWF